MFDSASSPVRYLTLLTGADFSYELPELSVVIDGKPIYTATNVSNLCWVYGKVRQVGKRIQSSQRAKLIVADHSRPLTWLLRKDPDYRIVYEDKVAVVFVPLK